MRYQSLGHTSLCTSIGIPFGSLLKSSRVPDTLPSCSFVHWMTITAPIEPLPPTSKRFISSWSCGLDSLQPDSTARVGRIWPLTRRNKSGSFLEPLYRPCRNLRAIYISLGFLLFSYIKYKITYLYRLLEIKALLPPALCHHCRSSLPSAPRAILEYSRGSRSA